MLGYDTIVMTRMGFKKLSTLNIGDAILNIKGGYSIIEDITMDYLTNCNTKVTFSSGESITCSKFLVIPTNGDRCKFVTELQKNTKLDIPCIPTDGFAGRLYNDKFDANEAYEIGYKGGMIPDNICDAPTGYRKEFLAGIIDSPETIKRGKCVCDIVYNNDVYGENLIILLRSLGCSVSCLKQDGKNVIKSVINNNLVRIPSRIMSSKLEPVKVAYSVKITKVEDCLYKSGITLKMASNEPIMVGYTMVPVIIPN